MRTTLESARTVIFGLVNFVRASTEPVAQGSCPSYLDDSDAAKRVAARALKLNLITPKQYGTIVAAYIRR